jgi:two-component system, NtrC family, response regulator HydG
MIVQQAHKAVPILVVDDQAGIRLTLKGVLSRRGYDVSVAESGEAALEAARQKPFRVIFMDIKMPGMNGVDTLIKIKEINPGATVIMMTAYALEEEIRRAIREGAYAVAYKPFDMDRMLAVVDECLEDRTLVLVVDDAQDSRAMLRTALEKKGYRVVDAESGEEALTKIRERRFQIILLDIKLPGMHGVQALKEIKALRPQAAVIMMTGHPVEQLLEEAMREGSFACLHKPFDIEKLLEVVDRCLARENRGEDPA